MTLPPDSSPIDPTDPSDPDDAGLSGPDGPDEILPGAGPEGPIDLDDIEEELEDDDFEDEEEGDGGAEEGDEEAPKKKSKSKKRKGSDADEPVEHPDTPIPTKKKMRAALDKAFAGQDDVTERFLELMTEHALLLLETNRQMNLTAILDPKDIAIKHYLDSWMVTRSLPLIARRAVSYTHLRAHETREDLVCRLLLEKKK